LSHGIRDGIEPGNLVGGNGQQKRLLANKKMGEPFRVVCGKKGFDERVRGVCVTRFRRCMSRMRVPGP
jgi:hypothetical protein